MNKCLCGGTHVQIAIGEVAVFRCTSCHNTLICCVECHATVGGTKESEWLELRCRKCGHTTNIRKLLPVAQLQLFGGQHGKKGT